MATFFTELDEDLEEFIGNQGMFFVATAPAEGRINLSPKGMDCLRCIDSRTIGYMDMTGSGNETAAHLYENGRMTMMLCSFGPKPQILRLYGKGRSVYRQDAEWAGLASRFEIVTGARQIVLLEIESIQTSCGYAVPRYEFVEHRETLKKSSAHMGEAELANYRQTHNLESIDGQPTGLREQVRQEG